MPLVEWAEVWYITFRMEDSLRLAMLVAEMIAEELRLDLYEDPEHPGLEPGDLYLRRTKRHLVLQVFDGGRPKPNKYPDTRLCSFELRTDQTTNLDVPVEFITFADEAMGRLVSVQHPSRKGALVRALGPQHVRTAALVVAQLWRTEAYQPKYG